MIIYILYLFNFIFIEFNTITGLVQGSVYYIYFIKYFKIRDIGNICNILIKNEYGFFAHHLFYFG